MMKSIMKNYGTYYENKMLVKSVCFKDPTRRNVILGGKYDQREKKIKKGVKGRILYKGEKICIFLQTVRYLLVLKNILKQKGGRGWKNDFFGGK